VNTASLATTLRESCTCPWHAGASGSHGVTRRAFGAFAASAAGALGAAGAVSTAKAEMPECHRSRAAGLVPADSLEASAQQQYVQLLGEARSKRALAPPTHPQLQRLRYIAERIVPFTPACNARASGWKWEVNLLGSAQLNAFCMPGGKIAFFHGILLKLQLSDNEVATIMGHEIAHALLEHARERMAKSGGTQLLLRGGAALLGLGNLGDLAAQAGTQLLTLRFSREDESEADRLGLVLAARAGYDPRAGVSLWQKMGALSGGQAPPSWLSTHPAGADRIREIEAKLPGVMPTYLAARKPDREFAAPNA
jgi:predicted Zn-dependent protease